MARSDVSSALLRSVCCRWLGISVLLLSAAACGDAQGPTSGPRVAVTALESGRLVVVDIAQRRVVARLGLPLVGQGVPAVSADGKMVYHGGHDGAYKLVEVDIANARTTRSWLLPRRGYTLSDDTAQVYLHYTPRLTHPSDDRREFVLWPTRRNGQDGIARYRPEDDTLLGFRPMPVVNGGVTVLTERSGWPAGTLMLCASVSKGRPPGLMFMSPDLKTIDSIPLPPFILPPNQVIVDHQERFAYVKTVPYIFKVDLAARRVVAQAQTLSWGLLGMSPDGNVIYLADPGRSLDMDGTGVIALFSPDLQPLGSVDLNPVDRHPTTLMTVGINDSLAVVSAGTPPGTLGQRPQLASLFVINVRSRTVVDRIPLGEYGTPMLVVVP